jgi:hypothetical protein
MNRRITSTIYLLLLVISVTLTRCTPASISTPTLSTTDDITITNLVENPQMEAQIIQTKVYDQCESASPLKAQIQFSESNTSSQQKELVMSAGVSGEVGLSVAAKVEIQGSIEQHFASINTAEKGYQEVIEIDIPARTKQEYQFIWKETRSEGTIEYAENGATKSVDYSYRIGLQFANSIVKDIPCPVPITSTPSEAPIPSTPSATMLVRQTLADGCIFSETWNFHSTDTNALKNTAVGLNGCRSLAPLGISAETGNILHIFLTEKNAARSARIYTPIANNTAIEFDLFVNYMYLVYNDSPANVTFGVAQASDPKGINTSTRFKLQVEKNDSRPIVFFMLADTGEFTGTKIPNQHYEYGRTYNIRLELSDIKLRVYINGKLMQEQLSLPDGDKVFYIDYNMPLLSGLDLQIKNLSFDGEIR